MVNCCKEIGSKCLSNSPILSFILMFMLRIPTILSTFILDSPILCKCCGSSKRSYLSWNRSLAGNDLHGKGVRKSIRLKSLYCLLDYGLLVWPIWLESYGIVIPFTIVPKDYRDKLLRLYHDVPMVVILEETKCVRAFVTHSIGLRWVMIVSNFLLLAKCAIHGNLPRY